MFYFVHMFHKSQEDKSTKIVMLVKCYIPHQQHLAMNVCCSLDIKISGSLLTSLIQPLDYLLSALLHFSLTYFLCIKKKSPKYIARKSRKEAAKVKTQVLNCFFPSSMKSCFQKECIVPQRLSFYNMQKCKVQGLCPG